MQSTLINLLRKSRQCRAKITEGLTIKYIIFSKEMIKYFTFLAYSVNFLDTWKI